MTWRRPSDIRLVAITSRAMAPAGKSSTQGAIAKKLRASLICSPQSGEGGCTPRPRKPSDATRKIEYEKRIDASTSSGGSELGSTSRKRM